MDPAPLVDSIDADYQLIASWRAALRSFHSASKRILKLHGVTPMQYQALLVIRITADPDGITVSGLSEELGIRHNSTVGLINRMEAHGDVKRERSRADRRVAHLRITPAGESMLHKLVEAHWKELGAIAPEMKRIFARR